jgi:hypothetical protein
MPKEPGLAILLSRRYQECSHQSTIPLIRLPAKSSAIFQTLGFLPSPTKQFRNSMSLHHTAYFQLYLLTTQSGWPGGRTWSTERKCRVCSSNEDYGEPTNRPATDPYGSSESTRVDGTAMSSFVSWDSKITTVNAVLGGVKDFVRIKMQQDGIYDEFISVTQVRLKHYKGTPLNIEEDSLEFQV